MTTNESVAQEQGAAIIKLAVQLMAEGQARGWSDALARARAIVWQEVRRGA